MSLVIYEKVIKGIQQRVFQPWKMLEKSISRIHWFFGRGIQKFIQYGYFCKSIRKTVLKV